MQKKLLLVAIIIWASPTISKVNIGSVSFFKKIGKALPIFANIQNKNIEVFSTPFILPIENNEVIKNFLPTDIKELLNLHSDAHVSYFIRISTSINKIKNIKKEYESINYPWSLLFHGWAYRSKTAHPKIIEWGVYNPISYKNNISIKNYSGFEDSLIDKENSIISINKLNKEKIFVEHNGHINYTTTLAINNQRNFINIWTFGYLHENNEAIVIYELIIKEPSLNDRINQKTQGVFFSDIFDETNFNIDKIKNRLKEYEYYLKDKSFNPKKAFNTNLKKALSNISSESYKSEDIITLENFNHTFENIHEMIKASPLTDFSILNLAETVAQELHSGKNIEKIKKSLKLLAPHATPEQISRIFEEARNIPLNIISNNVKTLTFENNLKEALKKISKFAYESKNRTEFINKCDNAHFNESVTNDIIYKTNVFQNEKKFIIKEIDHIYEKIQFALKHQAQKEKRGKIKKLSHKLINLNEQVHQIHSFKEQKKLIKLVHDRLPKIITQFKKLTEEEQPSTKKINPTEKDYEEIINKIKKLSNNTSYGTFINSIKDLHISNIYTKNKNYQNAYLSTFKKVINNELNIIKNQRMPINTETKNKIKNIEKELKTITYNKIDTFYQKFSEIKEEININK